MGAKKKGGLVCRFRIDYIQCNFFKQSPFFFQFRHTREDERGGWGGHGNLSFVDNYVLGQRNLVWECVCLRKPNDVAMAWKIMRLASSSSSSSTTTTTA